MVHCPACGSNGQASADSGASVIVACLTLGSLIFAGLADDGAVFCELEADPVPCVRDARSRRGLSVPVGAPSWVVVTSSVGGVGVGVGTAGVAGVVVGSAHAPLVQTPLAHTVPQVPQWLASVARS